ncbi:MAG TPA: hypothetical protein VG603_00355, partial [Chitinophagales bacterium]|nr:hypothetical protein [Chitinophagales bacterium]
TPAYVEKWLPTGPLAEYSLAFSIEMNDTSFNEYLDQTFPTQIKTPMLKVLYKIDDTRNPVYLADSFKAWKQEKVRLNRVKWLEQYPWVVTVQDKEAEKVSK